MSKVMLVMEKPENCLKCEFSDRRLDGTLRCTRNKDSSNTVFGLSIPIWCPLKDIPNKIERANGDMDYYKAVGFNACIDEILKENNKNE